MTAVAWNPDEGAVSPGLASGGVERALVLAAAVFAPLFTARIPGVNFTLFDGAVLALFAYYTHQRVRWPREEGYAVAAFFLIVAALIASLFAISPERSFGQAAQWIFILMVAVPVASVVSRSDENLRAVMVGQVIAGAFLVLHSVFEFATGRAEFEGGRYRGILEGSQPMAFAVSVILPFVVLTPFTFTRARARMLATGAVAFTSLGLLWVLLVTASRTGVVSLVASFGMILLAFPFVRRPHALTPGLRRGLIITALIVAAIVGLVLLFGVSDDSLFGLLRRRLIEKTSQSATSDRFLIYGEALDFVRVPTLLHGLGLENYQLYSRFETRPHNIMLILLTEGGMLMLVSFLGLIGLLFSRCVAYLTRPLPATRVAHICAVGAVAAFVVFLVIATFNTQSVHRIYWFNFGLAFGLLARLTRPRAHPALAAVPANAG